MYQNWLPWILYLFLVIEFHHVINLSWEFHLNYYNDLIHHITVILYYTRTLVAYGLEFLLYTKFSFWRFLLSKTRKSKFSLLIFGGCWPPIFSLWIEFSTGKPMQVKHVVTHVCCLSKTLYFFWVDSCFWSWEISLFFEGKGSPLRMKTFFMFL